MGGSIGEHVWRQSYKMSTSKVTNGANLKKCQLLILCLISTSTVILARILQSVNFLIYRYILGNTNTGVCSDIGNTNTSIHPVSYCPIWEEAVLIPDLNSHAQTTAPIETVEPLLLARTGMAPGHPKQTCPAPAARSCYRSATPGRGCHRPPRPTFSVAVQEHLNQTSSAQDHHKIHFSTTAP